MTKVTSLTQQQRAELWAGIRHDIGLSGDSPLLSRHFPAAEHNLAQRLLAAQKSHSARQLLAQLGEYLRLGNNRQAVTDYIRHNFGQTPLNQLGHENHFSPCCRKGRWLFLATTAARGALTVLYYRRTMRQNSW